MPALGALVAEPAFILVDTAVVGHLGTEPLAALALAGTVLTTLVGLCVFLAYGTTAHVARLAGAGDVTRLRSAAAQAMWLGLGIGLLALALLQLLATPAIALIGGGAEVAPEAERFLRVAGLGVPALLVALAVQGAMRGLGDLATPLRILVAGNLANAGLNVTLVYGAGLGLLGSAIGTAIAQTAMGIAFVAALRRALGRLGRPRPALMRPLLGVSAQILVRTAALLVAFATASAVVARVGPAALGAHQICFQLFLFLAFALDAIAIAGQVLVARMLGAGDARGARVAALRMLWWSTVLGGVAMVAVLALAGVLPEAFTSDSAVLAQAGDAWPLFAALLPISGAVWALDGVLIGAADTRYLMWSMLASLAVFAPVILLVHMADGGIVGAWWAIGALMAARLVTCGARLRGGAWAVTGSGRAAGGR